MSYIPPNGTNADFELLGYTPPSGTNADFDFSGATPSEIDFEVTGKEAADGEISFETTGGGTPSEIAIETHGKLDGNAEVNFQVVGKVFLPIAPTYRILVKDENDNFIGEFEKFRSLKFGKRLNNYGTASFEVPANDPKVSELVALRVYTVWIYYEENATSTLVWAGEQAMRAGSLDANGNNWCTIHCFDWFEQLNSRFTADNVRYDQIDAGQIAWALIDTTQSQTNGDLGITEGTIEETQLRDREYFNQNVMEAISNLANVLSGFDFEITNNRVFNVYSLKGTDLTDSVVLEYGHNVVACKVIEDFVAPANRAIVLGTPFDGTELERIERNNTVNQGIYKLREAVLSEMDVSDINTMQDKGDALLRKYEAPLLKIDLTILKSSRPKITEFSLGDLIRLIIKSGIYNIDEEYRIFEWTIDIGNDTTQDISLVLGRFTIGDGAS